MRTIQTIMAALLATAVLSSCRSNAAQETYEFECTCGEAEADFYGCLHPICADGKTNPDNLDCACGPLIEEEE